MKAKVSKSFYEKKKKTCVFSLIMLICFFNVLALVFIFIIKPPSSTHKKEITPVTKALLLTQRCEDKWVLHNGYCYKVEDKIMRFSQAAIFCRLENKGSYLADISSDDEFEWIRKNFSNKRVWVNGTENII